LVHRADRRQGEADTADSKERPRDRPPTATRARIRGQRRLPGRLGEDGAVMPRLPVGRAILRLAMRRRTLRRLAMGRLAGRRAALRWPPLVRRLPVRRWLAVGRLRAVRRRLTVRRLLAIGWLTLRWLTLRRLTRVGTVLGLWRTTPWLTAVRAPVVPCHTEMLGLVATSRPAANAF
jgi:hypothetical protein